MRKVLSVPYINQAEKWPTGCESVTTVMALQYLGIPVDVDTFIQNFIPMEGFSESPDGKRVGPNPDKAFVGSPYDKDSFGCFPGVIVPAAAKCLAHYECSRYLVKDATGETPERYIAEIDAGRPVIYWSSIDLNETYPGDSWEMSDGSGTYTWINNEHCMLLVGYDTEKDTWVFNDPWNNHGVIDYPREQVLQRHKEQREGAVIFEEISEKC